MGDDRSRPARPDLILHPLILIGLGANLDSPIGGTPRETLAAALAALEAGGAATLTRSSWYRSAPVPASGQPWYTNAVASITTLLDPHALLALMQSIEFRFGRVRSVRNAARVLDLDLLDYRGAEIRSPDLVLPHPRLERRRFVLEPLAEIAPQWRHPIVGLTAAQLLRALADEQPIEKLPG
jgi:2-amino-4-hydroxy-6-hydroxymethyldihydropteridine diphosphokinase